MMRKSLLFILLIELFVGRALAGDAPSGEELFRQGKWKEAADEFKRSLGDSLTNGSPGHVSLYNLGTALAKSGETGEAYGVLLKGYYKNPFDADLNHNLAFVEKRLSQNSRNILPNTWIRWWPHLVRAIPFPVWLLFSFASLLPVLWFAAKPSNSPGRYVGTAFSLSFLLIGLFNIWQSRYPVSSIIKQAQIRSGPDSSFEEIANMEPGSLVNVEENRDGWLKVRFQTQNSQEIVGWIESHTTLRVLP